MSIFTIKLDELVTLHQGVTPDEAQPVYEKIAETIKNGDSVELDFEGVQLATTAFLNVAIGKLYEDYTSEDLKQSLTLMNVDDDMALRIKKVTDNAKLFYANKLQYEETLDDVLYGDGE